MDESSVGGPGPEETNAPLPPDLEQEKKEIEARIDQHVAKLQEIADVFGIDTSKFSDEDDREFAKEIEERKQLMEEWKKNHGINELPRMFLFDDKTEIEVNEFPLRYVSGQAEHIRRVGRITDTGHINIVSDIVRGSRIFLTPSEAQAIGYLRPEERKGDLKLGDLHTQLEGDLMFLEMQVLAQHDEVVRNFVNWVISKKLKSSDPTTFVVDYGKHFPDRASQIEEHLSGVGHSQQEKGFASNFRYGELSKAKIFAGRVITRIADNYNKRIGYLMDLVHSGHPAFQKDEESSDEEIFYKLNPNFRFTEEDAKKAKELNLPWSKLEKKSK